MGRLEKQLEFILEADKLKKIGRQTYLSDGSRKENDAEHSFHLALMCALLSEHANEEIDVLKTMTMVLIHDVVEIDAGDTYAYDPEAHKDKIEREQKAAERLFGLLPTDQGTYFKELWEEFEEGETKEARFAGALDKFQPTLLNNASCGKSWKEHGVKAEQVFQRVGSIDDGSGTLWDYCKGMLEENIKIGNLAKGEQQDV